MLLSKRSTTSFNTVKKEITFAEIISTRKYLRRFIQHSSDDLFGCPYSHVRLLDEGGV